MNTRQKVILLSGIALLALSVLYPPWFYKNHTTSAERSAGFHLFNSPPSVEPYKMREIFSIPPDDSDPIITAQIDKFRLLVQSVLLASIMVGSILIFSS